MQLVPQATEFPHWWISLGRSAHIRMCGRDLRGVDCTADSCWTENYFSIHWVFLLFHNEIELAIDDFWFVVPPFVGIIVPPHSHLTVRFLGRSVHHWVHFSCQSGRRNEVPIPSLTNMQSEAAEMKEALEMIVAKFQQDKYAANAEFVRLLERIVHEDRAGRISSRSMHWGLQRALEFIERNLHKEIHVSDVVGDVGVSQRQLLNLMKELTGESIIGFIRRRRGERARHLLTQTIRPIQSIAVEVGIPDLHLFNKTIRQIYGKSPRELRRCSASLVEY